MLFPKKDNSFDEFIVDHFGVSVINNWPPSDKFDAVVIFSPHKIFKEEKYSLKKLKEICPDNPIIFDIKRFYQKKEAEELGFKYLTL